MAQELCCNFRLSLHCGMNGVEALSMVGICQVIPITQVCEAILEVEH